MIISRLFTRIRRSLPAPSRALVPVSLALSAMAVTAAPASDSPVGEVSLMIGSARVVHRDGTASALQRGARIKVGDRIETTPNGHVHIRFIDNASISVRPDSVLEVQVYRYDSGNPQDNEVKLNVGQGMSRSISGRATETDKSRFRLNTPLAAIGVRGTDFLVQTTDAGVRASVADGAIVVGALGGSCTAAGLGPCSGTQTSVLSANMGRLMVEVRRGDDVARLVPIAGALLASAAASAEERVAAIRASETAARHGGMLAAELTYNNHNDPGAADLLTIAEASIREKYNSRPDNSAQLVWGRYTGTVNDEVSLPYSLARIGREFTVGSGDATLWRKIDPAYSDGLLTSIEADASFRLSRAQATFESGGRTESAAVDGTLVIDFARRTFATALSLSSASAGQAELRVGGPVLTNGTFGAKDSTQKVSGAVSLDTKEAGYLFERVAAGGLFKGKTLWGR
jgi:hypothetical protein